MARLLESHDDPGAQPERTYLAWLRTMLAAGVVGLLAVRLGVLVDAPPLGLIGLVTGIMVMAGVSQFRRHRVAVHGLVSGRLAPAAASVLSLGGGVVLLGLSALWFLLVR